MVSIAIFADSHPSDRNGVGVAIDQLRRHINDKGMRVVAVSPSHYGGAGRECELQVTLPSWRLPGIHPRIANILGARKYAREVDRWEPDLVHIHGFGPASLLGVYFARSRQLPLVVSWHTDLFEYARHYSARIRMLPAVGRIMAAAISRFILGRADIVIAPSMKTAQQLAGLGGRGQIVVIPSGVDRLDRDLVSERRHSGLTLLYVGRIAPEKGIELLLQAFELLQATNRDMRLILVGDLRAGRLRSRMPYRRALSDAVTLVGEVPRPQLASYYAAADIFVFPSSSDTQGLVLHEAAHAGLPIVSVDRALDLVVKDGMNGAFAEPNPRSLADAIMRIEHLLTHQEWRARAGSIGLELAERYSVQSRADAVVEQYRRLLESSRGLRR